MEKNETTQNIRQYFTGMKRGNIENLKLIASSENWQKLAEMELHRRRTEIIQMMTDEDLQHIANGEVDPASIAKEILDPN